MFNQETDFLIADNDPQIQYDVVLILPNYEFLPSKTSYSLKKAKKIYNRIFRIDENTEKS